MENFVAMSDKKKIWNNQNIEIKDCRTKLLFVKEFYEGDIITINVNFN